MRKPKQQKPLNDLSRSLTPFYPNQTLIAVIEPEELAGRRHHTWGSASTSEEARAR
jgi:hypothetical protein